MITAESHSRGPQTAGKSGEISLSKEESKMVEKCLNVIECYMEKKGNAIECKQVVEHFESIYNLFLKLFPTSDLYSLNENISQFHHTVAVSFDNMCKEIKSPNQTKTVVCHDQTSSQSVPPPFPPSQPSEGMNKKLPPQPQTSATPKKDILPQSQTPENPNKDSPPTIPPGTQDQSSGNMNKVTVPQSQNSADKYERSLPTPPAHSDSQILSNRPPDGLQMLTQLPGENQKSTSIVESVYSRHPQNVIHQAPVNQSATKKVCSQNLKPHDYTTTTTQVGLNAAESDSTITMIDYTDSSPLYENHQNLQTTERPTDRQQYFSYSLRSSGIPKRKDSITECQNRDGVPKANPCPQIGVCKIKDSKDSVASSHTNDGALNDSSCPKDATCKVKDDTITPSSSSPTSDQIATQQKHFNVSSTCLSTYKIYLTIDQLRSQKPWKKKFQELLNMGITGKC